MALVRYPDFPRGVSRTPGRESRQARSARKIRATRDIYEKSAERQGLEGAKKISYGNYEVNAAGDRYRVAYSKSHPEGQVQAFRKGEWKLTEFTGKELDRIQEGEHTLQRTSEGKYVSRSPAPPTPKPRPSPPVRGREDVFTGRQPVSELPPTPPPTFFKETKSGPVSVRPDLFTGRRGVSVDPSAARAIQLKASRDLGAGLVGSRQLGDTRQRGFSKASAERFGLDVFPVGSRLKKEQEYTARLKKPIRVPKMCVFGTKIDFPFAGAPISARAAEVNRIETDFRLKQAKAGSIAEVRMLGVEKRKALEATRPRASDVLGYGKALALTQYKYTPATRFLTKITGQEKRLDKEITKAWSPFVSVKPETPGKYPGKGLVAETAARMWRLDAPGIDVRETSRGVATRTGITLGSVGALSGGVAAGKTLFHFAEFGVTQEFISKKTGSPLLGLVAGGLAVRGTQVAASKVKGYSPGVESFKFPFKEGTGRVVVGGVGRRAVAFYASKPGARVLGVRGAGFIEAGRGGFKVSRAQAPALGKLPAVRPSKVPGYMPVGALETSFALSSASATPGFIPSELTRLKSGVKIMEGLERQPSSFRSPIDYTNIKGIPEGAGPVIEKTWMKYQDKLVAKGSAAAGTQLSPSAKLAARQAGDIDWATIGGLETSVVKKDLFKGLTKAGFDVDVSGATVKFKSTGKGIDVVTREQLLLEGGETMVEGETRFGFDIKQKPIKIGGKKIQSLSEQLIRKGSMTLTFQEKGGIFYTAPGERGRIFKDAFDFQETVAPSLIESAKKNPFTYLRGRRAEYNLMKFKGARGEDITAPRGMPELSFFTRGGKAQVSVAPKRALISLKAFTGGVEPVKGGASLVKVPRESFYYATPKAYAALFPKKHGKGYPSYYPSGKASASVFGFPSYKGYSTPRKQVKIKYPASYKTPVKPKINYQSMYKLPVKTPEYKPLVKTQKYKTPSYSTPYTPPYKPGGYKAPYYPTSPRSKLTKTPPTKTPVILTPNVSGFVGLPSSIQPPEGKKKKRRRKDLWLWTQKKVKLPGLKAEQFLGIKNSKRILAGVFKV